MFVISVKSTSSLGRRKKKRITRKRFLKSEKNSVCPLAELQSPSNDNTPQSGKSAA